MKETFYFSHDYNSRTDEKIKVLLRKYGSEGYGIYWMIIEDLYQNANALRLDIGGIAYDYRTQEEIVNFIIKDTGLFDVDGDIFYSKSVGRRLDERAEKSAKAREKANKRWGSKNAVAMQKQCSSNASAMQVKERKGKNIYIHPLEKLIGDWNSIKEKGIDNYWHITQKKTTQLKTVFDIFKKQYTDEEFKNAANKYIDECKGRDKNSGSYFSHRFTLYEFLKQGNGLNTYINK